MPEKRYLRQNTQMEPLVDHWYAWPHLISPATAARNITERHMKIMNSYLNAPQVHEKAVKNPKMLGGPFCDLGGQHLDEVRELRDSVKRDRAHLVELSAAIGELDGMLRDHANGYSLHPLYAKVPACLRGFVELAYDLNHHPSFRLIEPLMYKSRHYDQSMQSFMLSPTSSDDRPFVLSTPRFETPDSIHVHLPFDDGTIDDLFRTKTTPREPDEIQEMLGVPASRKDVLRSFLTSDPPPTYQPYQGKGVRWRYFGHACILVECQGVSVLFDPVLSYTYESGISRYTYLDLPDTIDYVLITHNHQDHVLIETLMQIRHKVKHLVVPRSGSGQLQDPSLKLAMQRCGFKSVIELDELEELREGNVRITGLPFLGEHADLAIRTKLAWLLRLGERTMLFAADSCNIEPELYHRLHQVIGNVDALFLGMECDGAPLSWLYGPLLTQRVERAMDESRRLSGSNFDQGMNIIKDFGCREVYVYAMGQEPWLNYIMSVKYTAESRPIIESNKLVQACRERGIISERLFGEREILLEGPSPRSGVGTVSNMGAVRRQAMAKPAASGIPGDGQTPADAPVRPGSPSFVAGSVRRTQPWTG